MAAITLIISILSWVVFIYSARVAIFGNPLWVLIQRTTPEERVKYDRLLQGETEDLMQAPAEMRAFLSTFGRWSLAELFLFLLELGLLVFLWRERVLPGLCLGLLIKDLAVAGASITVAIRLRRVEALFELTARIPGWLIVTDRASAAVSAVGFLLLVLGMNGLLPGVWTGCGLGG